MGIRNSPSEWGWAARFFHWATALLISATIPIGWWANSLERGATERALFDLHFQLGLLILLLVLARLLWRMFDSAPQPPDSAGSLIAKAAAISHRLLYLTILTMIVSGYIIQLHMRPSLKILGFSGIPRPFEPGDDESLRAVAWYVHSYGFWLLVGLIRLHVGAALWHHVVRRDNVLIRMLPYTARRIERRRAREEVGCGRIRH